MHFSQFAQLNCGWEKPRQRLRSLPGHPDLWVPRFKEPSQEIRSSSHGVQALGLFSASFWLPSLTQVLGWLADLRAGNPEMGF